MSKKRTSTESSKDEETTEGLDSVVQQEDNAKRANLTSFSDTKLQDLPMELIERILVKVVAMEVKDTKLAKRVWKEKVDGVIKGSRLRTVCSQWNNILTTNFFRNEVCRTLDNIAQDAMRMEILHQSPVRPGIFKAATMKDEVFMMCSTRDCRCSFVINVYNRNDMAEVKEVIRLGSISPENMLACSVSNCLYAVCLESPGISVFRIKKDDKQKFKIAQCKSISGVPHSLCRNPVSVSLNGSLITIASHSTWSEVNPTEIRVYCADGTLQHKLPVSTFFHGFRYVDGAIQKSNGNLVLVCKTYTRNVKLLEMDMTGSIVRQFNSSFCEYAGVIFTDIYGRIVLTDRRNRYEFLDSEFNLMELTGLTLKKDQCIFSNDLNYNSETGEAVTIVDDEKTKSGVLIIFRFTEE